MLIPTIMSFANSIETKYFFGNLILFVVYISLPLSYLISARNQDNNLKYFLHINWIFLIAIPIIYIIIGQIIYR
jgi:hypothetical protein